MQLLNAGKLRVRIMSPVKLYIAKDCISPRAVAMANAAEAAVLKLKGVASAT